MTDAELAAMDAALEARLRPWIARAVALVRGHLDDAKAHAEKAITDALKATPDGRASGRRVARSPSYRAAIGHLDDLLIALVGPTGDSLAGLIRDARASFHADSVRLWKPHIPEEFRAVTDPVPTAAGERLMRGAIVHGYDLRRELLPAFEASKNELFVAVVNAGRRAATDRQGRDRLSAWHRAAADRLNRKVIGSLSDSDKAVHEATGLLLLAPQYRAELTNAAGDGGLHLPE